MRRRKVTLAKSVTVVVGTQRRGTLAPSSVEIMEGVGPSTCKATIYIIVGLLAQPPGKE